MKRKMMERDAWKRTMENRIQQRFMEDNAR
jgi:hypothetical protein